MADSKITALTALTAADPANDMIPIVDVSDTPPASGNTKRISINNLLACSPSATLASATITGDLTVRTNKLKVDSTGVAIGATSASYPLDVTGISRFIGDAYLFSTTGGTAVSKSLIFGSAANTSAASIYGQTASANSGILYLATQTGGVMTDRLGIGADGVFTFQNVGGVAGTAMTLNSTGLLVGTNATGYGAANRGLVVAGGSTSALLGLRLGSGDAGYFLATASRVELGGSGTTPFAINNNGDAIIIDTLRNSVFNVNSAIPSLGTNSQMVFNLTSNTNLRISVRGTDGTTRVANITLA